MATFVVATFVGGTVPLLEPPFALTLADIMVLANRQEERMACS
jgi:hypothetical protein